MAILNVYDAPDGLTGSLGEKQDTLERKFLVQTDNLADGPLVVSTAFGIPYIGSYWNFGGEYYSYCRCREVKAERKAPNSKWWIVTARYQTPNPNEDQKSKQQQDDPTLEIPQIDTGYEVFQTPVMFSISSTGAKIGPIVNSAGEVFDPPQVRDDCIWTLTIQRNESMTSPVEQVAQAYTNTINQDVFWGWQPGYCRCFGVKAKRCTKKQQSTKQTIIYLSVTYEFKFHPYSWNVFLTDMGAHYFDDNLKLQPFLDGNGHPFVGLLDGTGKALHTPIDEPIPSDVPPVILPPTQIYPFATFATLGLPGSYRDLIGLQQ